MTELVMIGIGEVICGSPDVPGTGGEGVIWDDED